MTGRRPGRPTADALTFRWSTLDDLAAIEEFQMRHFGPGSVQVVPGRCRWMYFEILPGVDVALAETASGELVAMCGHLPRQVRIGGDPHLAGFGVDFMVAPEWRRKGIGRRFLEMRLERFDLSLSTGQSSSMGNLYRQLDAVEAGRFKLAIHRSRQVLGSNLKSTARNLVAWVHSRRALRVDAESPVTFGATYPNEWARWRYDGPVYDDYRVCDTGDGLRKIICRREGSTNHVVDFDTVGDRLAHDLAAISGLGGITETRLLFTGNETERACRRAGFLIRPHGTRLVAMTRHAWLRAALCRESIDVPAGAGDADILRIPISPPR